MDQTIDHDALDHLLKRCGADWNAAQVHGLLCSRLAVTGAAGARRWFAQVLEGIDPDNPLRSECEVALDELCTKTWGQLVARQSEFVLLLPDDEESATQRAEAMGQWCEGFLHGLVSEKHSEDLKTRLAAEPLADIIKDMLQITRVVSDDEQDEDGEEEAFVELVEYLRVAAQLMYEELADFRPPADDEVPNQSETLH